jgi:23S rRNA (cytidine2498-2'-O)-methyltransferase
MEAAETFIVTSNPEFLQAALAELRHIDKRLTPIEHLAPGIILCDTPDFSLLAHQAARTHPTFVRHLAPVQAVVPITNEEQDTGRIAITAAALPTFAQLQRGIQFAVQSRFVSTDSNQVERAYSSGQLNQLLAEAFVAETDAVESIKKPRVIVSLLCTTHACYLGISSAEENLSSWPGGARRFANKPEQISRAEFKLLEVLEVFDLSLPRKGKALDLGAAPGGWTRLFLEAGMDVVAVDPAHLNTRLAGNKHLEHYRGYTESYLEEAVRRQKHFDIIANDMRMDARDAARLLVLASHCLYNDGVVISIFKLPHATREINPLTILGDAIAILNTSYGIVQARQLFHNRQEVTIVAAR